MMRQSYCFLYGARCVGILVPVPAIGHSACSRRSGDGLREERADAHPGPRAFQAGAAPEDHSLREHPLRYCNASEGKQIRTRGGIDLYNGTFVCPREVQIVGDCKPGLADDPPKKELPRQLTDDEADEIVWGLPEVQGMLERMKGTKVSPFSMITGYPDPKAEPGKPGAFYEIYVGERHETHTVRVMNLLIDAYNGSIFVYDEAADRVTPIEQYRKQVRK